MNIQSKRVILHIGPHKTGSTYIQKTLYDNRGILNSGGVFYPESVIGPQWGHHQLIPKLEKLDLHNLQSIFTGLLKEDYETLLSSENFDRLSDSGVGKLASVLSGFEVSVIYFVRSPAELIFSSWQESVKGGGGKSFFEYSFPHISRPFISRLFNHSLVLDKYAKHFGKNSVFLVDYDWAKNHGDVFDVFCDVAHLDHVKGKGGGKIINRSLPAWEVEVIRGLNLVGQMRGCLHGSNVRSAYLKVKKHPYIVEIINSLKSTIEQASVSVDLSRFYFENSVSMLVSKKYYFATPRYESIAEMIKEIPESGWMLHPLAFKQIEQIFEALQLET